MSTTVEEYTSEPAYFLTKDQAIRHGAERAVQADTFHVVAYHPENDEFAVVTVGDWTGYVEQSDAVPQVTVYPCGGIKESPQAKRERKSRRKAA